MTTTAIYTCYRQLHPPTGVDHAVFGSVTSPGSRDLVVAKAFTIELYRVHRDASPSSSPQQSRGGGGTPEEDHKAGNGCGFYLELAGTFPIAGNVTALAVIPVGNSTTPGFDERGMPQQKKQQDILVVSFDLAKTALVAYDPVLGRLSTLSIHNFDPDAIGPGSSGVESSYGLASALKDRPVTISSCDPAGRCLSAIVAGCLLVVLPTRRHVPQSVFLCDEARKRALLPRRYHGNRDPDAQSDNAAVEPDSMDQSDVSNSQAGHPVNGVVAGGPGGAGNEVGADDGGDDDIAGKGEERDSGGEEASSLAGGEGNRHKKGAGAFAIGGSRAPGVRPTVSRPFTIDLEAVGVTGFIKSAVFLEGFHEPALALLYEPIQACPGRLASMRSTCRLVVLSLNLVQGRAPIIWRVNNLPHDSWDLVAVPAPIGGVQVISTNAVIHVNDSEVLSILAVNGYARATVDDALLGCPLRTSAGDWDWASFRNSRSALEVVDLSSYDVCVELDLVRCAFVTPTSMIFSLRGGEVYALRLHVSPGVGRGVLGASGRVIGQSMRPVGRATPCSVLAVSAAAAEDNSGADAEDRSREGITGPSSGLLFMGSRVGDSLLVDYEVAVWDARTGGRDGKSTATPAKHEPEVKEEGAHGVSTSAAAEAGSTSTGGSWEVMGEAVHDRGGEDSTPGRDDSRGRKEGDEDLSSERTRGAAPRLSGDDGGGGEESLRREFAQGSEFGAPAVAEKAGLSETRGDDREDSPSGNDGASDLALGRREGGAPADSPSGEKGIDMLDAGDNVVAGSAKRGREKAFLKGDDLGGDGDGEEVNNTEVQLQGKKLRLSTAGVEDAAAVEVVSGGSAAASQAEAMDYAPLPPVTASKGLGDVNFSDAAALEKRGQREAEAVEKHAAGGGGNPIRVVGGVQSASPTSMTPLPSALMKVAHGEEPSAEEQDIIDEEMELYGARLGDGSKGGKGGGRGGGGGELAWLGSRDGERVIDAIGFRLKVVDSLCTLGPIVDASLVPSAYHVPRAAIALPATPPGGTPGRGSWGRGGGGGRRGAKAPAHSPSRPPLPPPPPPPPMSLATAPGTGGTSGGGIRTTLVCASGYGQHGSLVLFSAGLRTEVVVDLAVPGATGVFTAPEGVVGEDRTRTDTLVLVSASPLAERRVDTGANGGGPGGELDGPKTGHTRVLAFEDDLRVVELAAEAEGNPFVCDAATVDLCAMAGGTIVQAHAQGLRVTRKRQFVQEVLAAEDIELDGLGAGPDVTVLKAAAAGVYACCLLSNSDLHLMALEEGDVEEADLLPVGVGESEDLAGGDGVGGGNDTGGVWKDVEAMCMFVVQETLPTLDSDEATPAATDAGENNGSNNRGSGSARECFNHGLFLEDVSEENPDGSVAAAFVADGLSETEDGFSSEEEWATLYGTGGGRGILGVLGSQHHDSPTRSSCAEAPNISGQLEGGEGAKDSHSLPQAAVAANGKRAAHASEGWWGGQAWGGELRASGTDQTASTYLVICRRGGGLEVHACQGRGKESSTRIVFRSSKAVLAPPTLWNELLAPPVSSLSSLESDAEASPDDGDPASGEGEIGDLRRRSDQSTGDDNDEAEGGRGLSVATGVLVANGRRVERGDGAGVSNGSFSPSAARGGGREKTPPSDPMEGDASTVAPVPSAEGAKGGDGSGVTPVGYEGEDDGAMSLAVSDVLVHPVGAVDGPAALRRLVLVLHLDNGDLLVYQARMTSCEREGFCGREQVICFSKLSHDLITRPVKGVPHEAAVTDPSRGRALRGVRLAAGQEGVCFARPGCRSAMILAERGAVCITPIEQDDLGDGSGSPPLPPGAPPSWAGVGLGCLAPLNNRGAFPGGGFVGVTAGGGRLRFISAAPAAAQLVTPGASGGGGLGGGGQGHFIAAKIGVGATVHGLLHLPHELAQPGKMGDILKSLLLKRGHYVALVSRMEDSLAEEPMAEEDVGGEAEVEEDEEVEEILAQHAVKHKNWTVADPILGGAPQLLVHRFELRVLALAPGAAAALSSAPRGAPGGVHKESEGGVTSSEGVEDDGGGKNAVGKNGGGGGLGGEGVLVPDEFLSASTVESHPFDAEENALCMSLVKLEQGGSPRMHVAVGTGMNDAQGEDKAARGRLILFEVDYAYLAREGGGHEHAVKLRQVFAKEQLGPIAGESGPVSAVAQLGRHLILSVGKKVIVNRWDPKSRTLELIGFFDPRVYVIGLSVIKNRFVLVGDAYGSVQLVVWREEDHSLTQLSKDHEKCEVFSAEYLVDEPAMGIVVADGRRNLKVLQYAPNAPNSRGGTKLLCQSDFFLGSRVAKLTRRRTRGNLRGGARYCLLAGTLDGGLGAILPVDERMFRRLYALQGIMSNALGHNGSANPRAYRLFDRGPTFRHETKQNMLDGTLLWRFVGLDARTQHDLTRAIGTTVERVMSNLLDIDLASLF